MQNVALTQDTEVKRPFIPVLCCDQVSELVSDTFEVVGNVANTPNTRANKRMTLEPVLQGDLMVSLWFSALRKFLNTLVSDLRVEKFFYAALFSYYDFILCRI